MVREKRITAREFLTVQTEIYNYYMFLIRGRFWVFLGFGLYKDEIRSEIFWCPITSDLVLRAYKKGE